MDDERVEPPAVQLRRLVDGFRTSRAVEVAARPGLADLLATGPRAADDLAASADADPDARYRLLRTLSSPGVFNEGDDPSCSLTPLGDGLRSDAPEPVGG